MTGGKIKTDEHALQTRRLKLSLQYYMEKLILTTQHTLVCCKRYVQEISQKQTSGCTYFTMASSTGKYTFQPIGSQGGRYSSPNLPEHVS